MKCFVSGKQESRCAHVRGCYQPTNSISLHCMDTTGKVILHVKDNLFTHGPCLLSGVFLRKSRRRSASTGAIWRLFGRVMQLSVSLLIEAKLSWDGQDTRVTVPPQSGYRITDTIALPYDHLYLLEICTEMDIHQILPC